MDRIHDRVAGLDVHRDSVVACALVPGKPGNRERPVAHKERFSTTTAGVTLLRDWLKGWDVSAVALEATGVYWTMPRESLLEQGG